MRELLTRSRLRSLMRALADSSPARGTFHVYFVGGATAVDRGWRESTIDVDVSADNDRVFGDIQRLKDSLQINIEFVRPEDFVPMLSGAGNRHLFIETIRNVNFFHYDPYSQIFSKIVRGFRKDLLDAERFLSDGLVNTERFRSLIDKIPRKAYDKHPELSRDEVKRTVDRFLSKNR